MADKTLDQLTDQPAPTGDHRIYAEQGGTPYRIDLDNLHVALRLASASNKGLLSAVDKALLDKLSADGAISGAIISATESTYVVAYRTPFAITLTSVDLATTQGTCSVRVTRDGVSAAGFASPVAITTSNSNTTSGASIAAGSELALVITGASNLRDVKFALNFTRA